MFGERDMVPFREVKLSRDESGPMGANSPLPVRLPPGHPAM